MVGNVTFWSESLAFPLLSTLVLVPLAAMLAVLLTRASVGIAIGSRLCRNAAQFIFKLLSIIRV